MANRKNAKKGKQRRVDKGKIARYWSVRHPLNMARRARRIERLHGTAAAKSFVSLHSAACKHCEFTLCRLS